MSSDPAANDFFSKLRAKFQPEDLNATERIEKLLRHLYHDHQLNDNEFQMMEGILSFQARSAHEVMVPRIDAFMVDINDDFQENLDKILRQPYSRIPVYDADKDRIVGIIHIRTVLRMARQEGFDQLTYEKVMFKPLFVPETIKLTELLLEIQKTQRQLAILTDEYGGVVGLVTIEDLIEEIVGDIDDEVDKAEVLFHKEAENKYAVAGKMQLTDFNKEFGTDLEMEDVDTVAGYVIAKLGIIPSKGETLKVELDNGMIFSTRRMRGSRLLTLSLTLPANTKKEEEQED